MFFSIHDRKSMHANVLQFVIAGATVWPLKAVMDYFSPNTILAKVLGQTAVLGAMYAAAYNLLPPPKIMDQNSAAISCVRKIITMGVVGSMITQLMLNGEEVAPFSNEFCSSWKHTALESAYRIVLDSALQLGAYDKFATIPISCFIGGSSNLLHRNVSVSEFAFGCYNFVMYKDMWSLNSPNDLLTGVIIEGGESAGRALMEIAEAGMSSPISHHISSNTYSNLNTFTIQNLYAAICEPDVCGLLESIEYLES